MNKGSENFYGKCQKINIIIFTQRKKRIKFTISLKTRSKNAILYIDLG